MGQKKKKARIMTDKNCNRLGTGTHSKKMPSSSKNNPRKLVLGHLNKLFSFIYLANVNGIKIVIFVNEMHVTKQITFSCASDFAARSVIANLSRSCCISPC